MPKVDQQYEAARRQLIIDAAARCFTRSGYDGTSVDDVCREAGMSKGGLYTYFKSKEELFAAVCSDHWGAGLQQVAQGLEAEPTALGKLQLMGDAAFSRLGPDAQSMLELARMSLAVWNESARNGGAAHQLAEGGYTNWCGALERVILAGQQRGEIAPELDTHVLALLLIAVFDGLQVLVAIKGEPIDVDLFRKTLMRIVQGGIVNG